MAFHPMMRQKATQFLAWFLGKTLARDQESPRDRAPDAPRSPDDHGARFAQQWDLLRRQHQGGRHGR